MTAASAGSGRSTAAVLWLMILLVFLPIMAGHLVARHAVDVPDPPAKVEAAPLGNG